MMLKRRDIFDGSINKMEVKVDPDRLSEWENASMMTRPCIFGFFPDISKRDAEFILTGHIGEPMEEPHDRKP